jgi:hypothetical protein
LPNRDTIQQSKSIILPRHQRFSRRNVMHRNSQCKPSSSIPLPRTLPPVAVVLSLYGCLSRRKQRASAQTGAKTNRQQLLGLTALLLLSLSTRTTASLCPALLASSASVAPVTSTPPSPCARLYVQPARRDCAVPQGQQNPALSLRLHHNTRLGLTRCSQQVHLQTGQCVSNIHPSTRHSSSSQWTG